MPTLIAVVPFSIARSSARSFIVYFGISLNFSPRTSCIVSKLVRIRGRAIFVRAGGSFRFHHPFSFLLAWSFCVPLIVRLGEESGLLRGTVVLRWIDQAALLFAFATSKWSCLFVFVFILPPVVSDVDGGEAYL